MALQRNLKSVEILPQDAEKALLVGRVWSNAAEGPCPVVLRDGRVLDVSGFSATMSGLLEIDGIAAKLAQATDLPDLGALDDFLTGAAGRLLAPVDLQAIKAAGVTFADSMLERVIEEQAKGDAGRAQDIRAKLAPVLGDSLRGLVAGSEQAAKVKTLLQDMGLWSQYLEVGIGPDAEIFTKAQPMSSVGCGDVVGIHPISQWNNPEPEVVLAVRSDGTIVGATLGNDVNLRDVEGRSALLLGKAKDNNASCAIGPFIRFFDKTFTLDDVRTTDVALTVEGPEGFQLAGLSSISRISRDPEDLVAQTVGPVHQYPDGFALFLGTMFAPTQDRDNPGGGFTHKEGDIVTIAAPKLGALVNRMRPSDACEPWSVGIADLMRSLVRRGALKG